MTWLCINLRLKLNFCGLSVCIMFFDMMELTWFLIFSLLSVIFVHSDSVGTLNVALDHGQTSAPSIPLKNTKADISVLESLPERSNHLKIKALCWFFFVRSLTLVCSVLCGLQCLLIMHVAPSPLLPDGSPSAEEAYPGKSCCFQHQVFQRNDISLCSAVRMRLQNLWKLQPAHFIFTVKF